MSDITLITREEVGLRPARPNMPVYQPYEVTALTGHYFGPDIPMRNERDLFNILIAIQTTDMDTKGYSDIMYSLCLNPFRPSVIDLRGIIKRGAANGSVDSNRKSPAVLIPLGLYGTLLNVNEEAAGNLIGSAWMADALIEREYGKSLAWVGHDYWRPTACPGAWSRSMLPTFDMKFATPPFVPAPPMRFVPNPDVNSRPYLHVGARDMVDVGDGYVHYVQRVLLANGKQIAVDGIYGMQTAGFVTEVQRFFKVDPLTAEVGVETWPIIDYLAAIYGAS